MNERKLSASILADYDRWLRQEERADATREKYLRSIRAFAAWLGGAAVTKDAVTEWKSQLVKRRQAPSTVNTALAALMKGRTVCVIAHRLSTVRNSDAILVLDHGRIIERGTHNDLIAQHGTYYQLYTGAFELE